jgi:hypothetical protein
MVRKVKIEYWEMSSIMIKRGIPEDMRAFTLEIQRFPHRRIDLK